MAVNCQDPAYFAPGGPLSYYTTLKDTQGNPRDPSWWDVYNQVENQAQVQTGEQVGRAWNADPDSVEQKRIIDEIYQGAVHAWNAQNPSLPQAQVVPGYIGPNAQPNAYTSPNTSGLNGMSFAQKAMLFASIAAGGYGLATSLGGAAAGTAAAGATAGLGGAGLTAAELAAASGGGLAAAGGAEAAGGAAAAAGAGGYAAADAAGLAQMAADAGLTGQAAADFIASGGAAGSTAAAGAAGMADMPYDVGQNLTNNPAAFNPTSTTGLTASDIQQGYRIINGVKKLVDATNGSGGSAQSGTAPSFTLPQTSIANASTAQVLTAGLSLFDQLMNQGSPPNTASANAALQSDVANTAAQQAANNFNFYRTNYRPVEIAQTAAALKAGSPEMQEEKAAQAGATITQASHNAGNAEQLRQDQLGIRPDSGNSLAMANDRTIGTAANVAAGMNGARQTERLYGDQLRANTVAAGNNLQATAIGQTNAATGAAAGSTNSASTQQRLSDTQNGNIGTAIGAINQTGILDGLLKNTTPPTPVYDNIASGYNGYTSTFDPSYGTGNAAQNAGAVTGEWDFAKGGKIKRLTMPPSKCGYLKGGRVHGPGTGTSDSIPVAIDGEQPGHIAHDEYVINAKAVKRIGLKRLDRMNLLGLPKGSKMKDGVHFEKGEAVSRGHALERTSFAIGGRITATRSFTAPPARLCRAA